MKYLVIIDAQNDFITGSLGTPEAKSKIRPLAEYIKNFDGELIFTADTHGNKYASSLEGKKLPVPHCVIHTNGWKINSLIKNAAKNKNWTLITKNKFGTIKIQKPIKNPEEIYIAGFCTDICVISNALLLKTLFPNTPIKLLADLCAGTTPAKHAAAVSVMESCQIDVIYATDTETM